MGAWIFFFTQDLAQVSTQVFTASISMVKEKIHATNPSRGAQGAGAPCTAAERFVSSPLPPCSTEKSPGESLFRARFKNHVSLGGVGGLEGQMPLALQLRYFGYFAWGYFGNWGKFGFWEA